MSNMMRIEKLSLEVQSTLRSGISIVDVTHCVSELVSDLLTCTCNFNFRLLLKYYLAYLIVNFRFL